MHCVHSKVILGHLGSNGGILGLAFGKEPAYQRAAKLDSGAVTRRARLVVGYIATAPAVKEGSEREPIKPS
jgi:hypothetical protein